MAESSNKRKGAAKESSKSKKGKVESKSNSSSKRELKHERQSHRKHAEVVVEAKSIWNKLRLKSNSPDQVRELTEKLMELITGKMNEIALQHDASRVVQAAVQFGTAEQRRLILKEIHSSLAELAKVQYAHFLVIKIIKYCPKNDEDSIRTIVKAFRGSIPKLAIHAVGSRVVESLFLTLPPEATRGLKQEFYGPHFSLFASDNEDAGQSLAANLEKEPSKKKQTLEFVLSILNKCIQKDLFGYAYFQDLCAEYLPLVSSSDIRGIVPNLVDHSAQLLSTRSGAKVVVACASYGTAKDRRKIMKSLKGYTRSSLLHRDAYLAMIRLVQLTDDTVSIHKSILNEIITKPEGEDDDKSPLLDLALDGSASKLFLLLLVADQEARYKYFDPAERELFEKLPTVEENGEQVPTSKKDPELRRKELLQYLRKPLIDLSVNHLDELLVSLPGSRVLQEVYSAFHPEELVEAMIQKCVVSLEESDDSTLSVFEDPVAHYAIKHMILHDVGGVGEDATSFSEKFLAAVGGKLVKVASSSRGAFVVAALCKVSALKKVAAKRLKPHVKQLSKLAKGKGATAGFAALLNELK